MGALNIVIDIQPLMVKLGYVLLCGALMYFAKAFWLTYKEMRVEE